MLIALTQIKPIIIDIGEIMRTICFQIFAALLVLTPSAFCYADEANYESINYSRAEEFIPANVIPALYNISVDPNWIKDSSSFWYLSKSRQGEEYILVDIHNGTRLPAFNHTALAAALAKASGEAVNPNSLPISKIVLANGTLRFSALNESWACDLESYAISKFSSSSEDAPGETLSPDGTLAAFVKDHNLWIREVSTGVRYPVTSGGSEDYAYAERSGTVLASNHPSKAK
jgi:dipeptidyl-peptidase 4